MNYFILLAIWEIAFIAWNFYKKGDKNGFYKGRIILRVAQIVTVILVKLVTKDSFGMRTKPVLIVLIVLLIFAIIRLFVKGENKKTGTLVIRGCLVIILLAVALLPAFIFANYNGLPTSGHYQVKAAESIWVDENRLETFESDGSNREVPVHFFYPDTETNEVFPLVIFSHGAFGYYQSNNSTYCELASKGYVVVSLDHPYHSFFTKDTEGKLITVNPDFINDVIQASNEEMSEEEIYQKSSEWLAIRNGDINFVIDYIKDIKNNNIDPDEKVMEAIRLADDTNIGLIGHSLGGAASVAVGRQCSDVKAVIDLDGTMLGEQVYVDDHYEINNEAYPVPLLFVSNDEHHNTADDYGILYVNNAVIDGAVDGREIYFKNAGHMNFTDLPLFSPALSSMLGTGSIDPRSCVEQMNAVIDNFFDYYLKNEGALTIQECYE